MRKGFAHLISPAVNTNHVVLSSNKIQNGDILVSANPGPPGKWPLKRRGISLNKFVRPRWPYDMRPSARAEKYIRDAGP